MKLGFVQTFLVVLGNDIRAEARSRQTVVTMVLFGIVLATVFAFGFTSEPKINRNTFPGILWGCLFFTSVLGVGRTFFREAEDGAFHALVLSPADRGGILMAKVVMNTVLAMLVMAVILPLLVVLLNVELVDPKGDSIVGLVCLQLVSGDFLYLGRNTARSDGGDGPFLQVCFMLIFPMVTPVLVAGVASTGIALGTSLGDSPWTWLQVIWGIGAVFGALGMVLFERMVTE